MKQRYSVRKNFLLIALLTLSFNANVAALMIQPDAELELLVRTWVNARTSIACDKVVVWEQESTQGLPFDASSTYRYGTCLVGEYQQSFRIEKTADGKQKIATWKKIWRKSNRFAALISDQQKLDGYHPQRARELHSYISGEGHFCDGITTIFLTWFSKKHSTEDVKCVYKENGLHYYISYKLTHNNGNHTIKMGEAVIRN